jgi:flagella basal body P-ring formation protein FlgA
LVVRKEGRERQAVAVFSALFPAWIAKRRILPGERVSEADLTRSEIDLARGLARESRGLILDADAELGPLEARQTVLAGQWVTTSAVQRVPDLRRGELVRVRLISGGITLMTQASAVEAGYVGSSLRVLTQKTKRDLVGKLGGDGVVEVVF